VVPKGKGQLASDRVQNPHDAEATYAVKGQGAQKKEHVGFKIQVAETVSAAVLAPGEPTRNFLTGIVTHRAHESDEVGEAKMEEEQAGMGLAKPPVQYVDGAYVSADTRRKGGVDVGLGGEPPASVREVADSRPVASARDALRLAQPLRRYPCAHAPANLWGTPPALFVHGSASSSCHRTRPDNVPRTG
jgi:hypothetical protein